MDNRMRRKIFFLFGVVCWFSVITEVQGAACPGSESYGLISYNHQLLNQYVTSGTYSQASGLTGAVGIQISPSGVINAGNTMVNRTIDLVYTTPDCDCLAESALSMVSVSITGTCSNGILNLQIQEVYPESSAAVTCTGDDSCPRYIQTFPGSSNSFSLQMGYANGATVTRPYTCTHCSGIYSWRFQGTSEPPGADDIQPVRIVPLLHLLLHRANQE